MTVKAHLTINATKAAVWAVHTDIGHFDPEGNEIELW